MSISATITNVVINKNHVIRMTAVINGREYSSFCSKGQYEYNEIASEVDMFFNIWAQAAMNDSKFETAYSDVHEFIPVICKVINRSNLFVKAA